jgi:hypothetical protein
VYLSLDINLVSGDEVVWPSSFPTSHDDGGRGCCSAVLRNDYYCDVASGRGQEVVVVVGACWYCSPAAEAVESVVVELILDINPSELQGDVSEVDRERGRCHYMQKNQSVLDIRRKD